MLGLPFLPSRPFLPHPTTSPLPHRHFRPLAVTVTAAVTHRRTADVAVTNRRIYCASTAPTRTSSRTVPRAAKYPLSAQNSRP
eukprot:729053-Rhodomonas_salina.2